jgi:hypothetical protein
MCPDGNHVLFLSMKIPCGIFITHFCDIIGFIGDYMKTVRAAFMYSMYPSRRDSGTFFVWVLSAFTQVNEIIMCKLNYPETLSICLVVSLLSLLPDLAHHHPCPTMQGLWAVKSTRCSDGGEEGNRSGVVFFTRVWGGSGRFKCQNRSIPPSFSADPARAVADRRVRLKRENGSFLNLTGGNPGWQGRCRYCDRITDDFFRILIKNSHYRELWRCRKWK